MQPDSKAASPWLAILPVLVPLGMLYLFAQLARNSLGVITGDLEASFGLHATQTAALTGVMFLGYAAAQIPGGLLLARLGPRRVLPVAGALLSAGFLAFSVATSFWGLLASRLLMGIVTAPVLPGALAIYLKAAGSGRFTALTGLQTAFGRAGVVIATVPLAALIAAVGWRGSFGRLAIASALAVLLVALVLMRGRTAAADPGHAPTRLAEVMALLRVPGLKAGLVFQGINSAVGSVILGLWGAPWLTNVYGMSLSGRSAALSAMALGWAVSALPWGWLARSRRWSRPAIVGAAAVSCACLAVAAAGALPQEWLILWFLVLGPATGSFPAVLDEVRQSVDAGAVVHVVALVTMGSMGGVFVMQILTGLVIDAFAGTPGRHPPEAYAAVFALLAVSLAVSTLVLVRWGPKTSEEPARA
jgi:MFS family permease